MSSELQLKVREKLQVQGSLNKLSRKIAQKTTGNKAWAFDDPVDDLVDDTNTGGK